jgi:hypothetical protein
MAIILPRAQAALLSRHRKHPQKCAHGEESWKGYRKLDASRNFGPTVYSSWIRSSMQIMPCLPRCCDTGRKRGEGEGWRGVTEASRQLSNDLRFVKESQQA